MTLDITTLNQEALELTGEITANPGLAKPLLNIIKKLGKDLGKLNSLDLSVLTRVQDALPKSLLSADQILRVENRIQDNIAVLAKLGFKGELPPIPQELLEECARTSGTLVLKFKTTILDYKANLNAALGLDKEHLFLWHISEKAESLATTNEEPSWINVPNTVRAETLGMPKATALNQVAGSATCDPMDTILMLGYNNLQTGQQLAGFTNKFTFTNQKNTLVGSLGLGINVCVSVNYDDSGRRDFGLAPHLAPESKG